MSSNLLFPEQTIKIILVGDSVVGGSLLWTKLGSRPPSTRIMDSYLWAIHKIDTYRLPIQPLPPSSSAFSFLRPEYDSRATGKRPGMLKRYDSRVEIEVRIVEIFEFMSAQLITNLLGNAHIIGLCYDLSDENAIHNIKHKESSSLIWSTSSRNL